MPKHRVVRFFALLWCLLFALSLLGCAAPLIQGAPDWGFLPSRWEVDAEKARLAIPSDLRAKLNAIAALSCKTAENTRSDPRYVGQVVRDPYHDVQRKLLVAVLKWAEGEAQSPDSRIVRPANIQLLPMSPTEGQSSEAVPEAPSTLEHPVVQFSGGVVGGGAIGAVPFGPIGADIAIDMRLLPKGTYWARVGKACGEIVVGTGQIIFGCAGMSAGAGMSGTGGGAAVGVPVIAGSYAIAANGCLTAGTGLAEAHQLWREGDTSTNASAPAPRLQVVPKQVAKKAETQAPVATETPKAVAPEPGTVVVKKSDSGTVTTTRQRAAPGEQPPETTVTVTTSPTGTTTTTRVKPAPGSGKAAGPAPNSGAAKPHGGKVHNDAIDREVARLRQDPAISNIRKNQQQVDAKGNKVGTNRPDIQYDRNGSHHCVEFDTNPSNGSRHGAVIQQNDPSTNVHLRTP